MKYLKLVNILAGLTLIASLSLADFPLGLDRFLQDKARGEEVVALDVLDFLGEMLLESIVGKKTFNLRSLESGATGHISGTLSGYSKNSIVLQKGKKNDRLMLNMIIGDSQRSHCKKMKIDLLNPDDKRIAQLNTDSWYRNTRPITLPKDGDYQVSIACDKYSHLMNTKNTNYTLKITKQHLQYGSSDYFPEYNQIPWENQEELMRRIEKMQERFINNPPETPDEWEEYNNYWEELR